MASKAKATSTLGRGLRQSVFSANMDCGCFDKRTALFRKLKSLESSSLGKLGGRICAVVDLKTRYPVQTWFHHRPYAHESNFLPQLLELIRPKTLLLLDRGFWNFSLFDSLIARQADFITRLKSKAQYKSISVFSQSFNHRDTLIRLGTGYQGNPTHLPHVKM